jgi:glucose-1-phosphate thymidylyltransferase
MKGIILAGGFGTRLHPLTLGVSKQLLPVYDKPMIYYPLSMLMLAGIREILVISTPPQLPAFRRLLQSGKQWGLQFSYAEQAEPRGLADAYMLRQAAQLSEGALIFAYRVRDPERYGVVEFDQEGRALSIEEKPASPKTDYAVPGMYFYDDQVTDLASHLQPSARGELEITDLNNLYIQQGKLQVMLMGRGVAWLDAGTHEALMQAGSFVQAVQERQGMMISCPEEIAYRMSFIDHQQLQSLATGMADNAYKAHLLHVLREASDPIQVTI